MSIGITSVGIYLPEKILTNDHLSKIVDTNDEWITTRTGIKTRHISAENETTSSMSIKASIQALEKAGLDAKDIDFVVCSTTTPDQRFPSTATTVQAALGMKQVPAFDMGAVCGGFIYTLATAEAYIKANFAKKVLCICTERMSSIIDWTDRNTCILFGDAGTAYIVEEDSPKNTILQTVVGGDGNYKHLLYSEEKEGCHFLRMDGTGVFKQAIRIMTEQVYLVCEKAGKKVSDIDLLIPHQANYRIILGVAQRLGLDEKKAYTNLEYYGNTSAATIPLALNDAENQGRIKKGSLIATVALGGGFTWGASLIQY